ncbi:MAG: 1-acyl-sn-glycerol-3-phosphate acyltransferase [Fischerella sp. CENA71]|nr:1-acyl-sn-glycerol-3-phosphate acyltransferase [Fischerella sp. CENA71]
MINQNQENIINSSIEDSYTTKEYKFSWFDWFCLWYPPGWLILFNRHWQHYHSDPDGWNWLEYILFLIPCGFYLAIFIRWLRLGFRTPRQEISEFVPSYQQIFSKEILAPIVEKYFHGELHQIENLPNTKPLLLAMNHAGMCFPWDFLSLCYLLGKERGWIVRTLAGVTLFDHNWMVWWLPPGWSKVLGGVRAELDEFTTSLQDNTIILYAPEGLRGPRKGWQKRYKLEKFDISFIQLSQRFQIPVLPVICIGNENLHPWTTNLRKLQKLFKLPFLPLSPLILVFIIFPSMGVWAAKSHLRYFIQSLEIINLQQNDQNLLDNKRVVVYQRAQALREKMQNEINKLIKK